ncbi:tRNA adenosine(34) deaminase TadA [Moraxella cuniculi]|uniref:tRNA-specific adenosine deaminase n=1 Tax=Moraxella cuniculi TaxID=34061 RepID=A0A448GXH9_9GAMM|nr:tRNA adenosine(34) deaminase TadA [Moraxella cuniculi]VEG13472.1 tRNA-specific adenosine deaminase [Moraxella cuniculi]
MSKLATQPVQNIHAAAEIYGNFCQYYQHDTINLNGLQFWPLADALFMQQAINLAYDATKQGEVPVGAVLVHDNKIIGMGYNQPIGNCDATAHAEIVAIRAACKYFNNYRLPKGSTLYVTLEPCTMCFGALIHARVARVVYATCEPKSGVVGSRLSLQAMPFYNHSLVVQHGLFGKKCSAMMSAFFRQRRKQKMSC